MKQFIRYILAFLCYSQISFSQTLPFWEEGYLDIHHICTGRGNAAFLILPDGTTMLIDAGDLGDEKKIKQEILPAFPDTSKLPGEWVARYIQHFASGAGLKPLDYVFLTHFHNDHIGSPWDKAIKLPGRDYVLSGITEVAEYLSIDKLIDRNWPNYDYPSSKAVASSSPDFNNYLKFIQYQKNIRKTTIERFQVGSKEQFVLQYNKAKYPNFSIQNIYSSGKIWTGVGSESRSLFPDLAILAEKEYPSENMCSSVIKLSYGKFNYYSGGDLSGHLSKDAPQWRDVETPVGRLVGQVDVAVANHHSYSDGMNENIISLLRPQAIIIPVWDYYHPQPEVLDRMTDRSLYPEDRQIFATGMVGGNVKRLGEKSAQINNGGHIVIRVYPGGDKFCIYVLDATSLDYKVLSQTETMLSN